MRSTRSSPAERPVGWWSTSAPGERSNAAPIGRIRASRDMAGMRRPLSPSPARPAPARLIVGSMTIVPDDKNWTWVLERVCPECGFDAPAADREQVGATIRAMSTAWDAVLRRPTVRDRPTPSVWSPLEYGCHVRDVFRVFDGRLSLMLAEEHPRFANWDQD